MEKSTTKLYKEFDFAAARHAYNPLNVALCGEQITSPFDLYSVERLRDEWKLRREPNFGTDVFVMGKGPPKDLRLTHISGIPYWSKTRPWPVSSEGTPLQFLAQFCFADSKDLVWKLPGEILQLFVPQDTSHWFADTKSIHFEWSQLESVPVISKLPDEVPPYCDSEWYGVIHRTRDYPEAVELSEKLDLDSASELPIMNGTKIGGLPHGIQSESEYEVDAKTKLPIVYYDNSDEPQRFLCQLSSIQAAPNVPFPWTNQKEKLSLEFDESGIYGEGNECLFGDMGSIYIFINQAGKCIAAAECY